MNADLPETLWAQAQGLRSGAFSSVELTQHYLARIARFNPQLNAFITVCPESAHAQAVMADAARARGAAGVLTGIPYANKDIFCTRGVLTTCGSRMLANWQAPYDATVVERLAAAGMVMLGKTNMDEFAMGSSNETSYFGAVCNPWDSGRVPGGSSGGSAAAVAARLAPVATGSDTGGSIRQPAALCGISGLKPTYGRVSRWGMIAFASSLDQGGPMALTAQDLALMLNAMAGHDPRDSTSIERPQEDFSAALEQPLAGLRLGVPAEYWDASLDPAMRLGMTAALDQFRALGASVREVHLPHAAVSIPAYYVVACAEASSNLSRYDGVRFGHRCAAPQDLNDLYSRSRAEGFGAEVKRRILVGTYALSAGYYDAWYRKAQQLRRLIQQDFAAAFAEVDLLIGPTTPTTAFPLGSHIEDPLTMYLADVYTTGVNLAGLPALSVPAGCLAGLPFGLQLVGNYFSEARLLQAAHQYQMATQWHLQRPALVG